MGNLKHILKIIYEFISNIFVGLFFIVLLGIGRYMIIKYDFPLEWLVTISYYFVGIGVLHSIGKGMR